MLITVISLIVVLGVLVFVHEAGHFIAAKWAGIYVHRFSLGLGSPVPWLTFRRGETEYSISWLPLGGYVKMASREEDIASSPLEGGRPEDVVPANRMFEAKPVWQRMIVILAGVTMNALFAWFLYTLLAVKSGRPVDPVTTVGRVVDDLLPPEAEAFKRIQPGTRIVRVNGAPVTSWGEITNAIANTPDTAIRLELGDGSVVSAPIHPDALEQRLKAAQALQPYRAPVVGQVLPDRPAARAGVQPGDTIAAINGQPVTQWYDLLERLQKNGQRPLEMEVARAGDGSVSRSHRTWTQSSVRRGSPRRSAGSAWGWRGRSGRSDSASGRRWWRDGAIRCRRRPRLCARFGASSADASPSVRSVARSSSASWREKARAWGSTPSSTSWR